MNSEDGNQSELISALQSEMPGRGEVLSIDAVDRMDPRDFEALTGWLYGAAGDRFVIMPLTRDGGADIIARQGAAYKLIQTKHSMRGIDVPDTAIDQLFAAANLYQQSIKGPFQLVVVSNARGGSGIRQKAMGSGVHLILRSEIEEMLKRFRPTLADVVMAGTTRTATSKEGIRIITSS